MSETPLGYGLVPANGILQRPEQSDDSSSPDAGASSPAESRLSSDSDIEPGQKRQKRVHGDDKRVEVIRTAAAVRRQVGLLWQTVQTKP